VRVFDERGMLACPPQFFRSCDAAYAYADERAAEGFGVSVLSA
jgi:hypothetical protein